MKKKVIKKIFCLILLAVHLVSFSLFHAILAEEIMPDKNQLSTSIVNDAKNETSGINSQASSEVINTGDNVDVTTTAQTDTNVCVNNQNTANINQTTNAIANTGVNDASRNISFGGDAGVVTTGDASVNVNSKVDANNNTTVVSIPQSGTNASSDIVNTGNNLTTTTTAQSNTTVAVNNNNTTTINQTTNAIANTGLNRADRNISFGGTAGAITTGNASTNVNYLVTANGNVTLIGGDSNGHGPGSGASIILTNTGDNSRFNTSSLNNNFVTVNNNNQATINQTARLIANTGFNDASGNIAFGGDAGVITTGDAIIDVSMLADANRNFSAIFLGDPAFASSDVINTGDNVDIDTQAKSNTDIKVNNCNQANVNQTVNAIANTGFNKANRNIAFDGDAGVITTGDAEVNVDMIAKVNENVTVIKKEAKKITPTPTVTPKPTAIPTVTPKPTEVPTATPTPTAAVGGVVVTPSPTPTVKEVTPTPTVIVSPSPTITPLVGGVAITPSPTPEVLGVAAPILPAAGPENLLLTLADSLLLMILGYIFKKIAQSIINS